MKYLYLISQNENDSYDAYRKVVVCAESEKEAKNTQIDFFPIVPSYVWAKPKFVKVELLGTANENLPLGIILQV